MNRQSDLEFMARIDDAKRLLLAEQAKDQPDAAIVSRLRGELDGLCGEATRRGEARRVPRGTPDEWRYGGDGWSTTREN